MPATLPTYENAIDVLSQFVEAQKKGDPAVLASLAKYAEHLVGAARSGSAAHEEIISIRMRDWTVEEGEPAEGVSLEAGKITVSRSPYGITVDAAPPGTEGAHGLTLEFDQGSAKINVFRAGLDEIQATLRIDARGVHVSEDRLTGAHAVLFKGEEGTETAPGDWQPAHAAAAATP